VFLIPYCIDAVRVSKTMFPPVDLKSAAATDEEKEATGATANADVSVGEEALVYQEPDSLFDRMHSDDLRTFIQRMVSIVGLEMIAVFALALCLAKA
jgi:hypothetical protein